MPTDTAFEPPQIATEQAAETTEDLQQWLHLKQEEVSAAELADDYLNHPDKYHPGLATHIGNLLLSQGELAVVMSHLERFPGLDRLYIIRNAYSWRNLAAVESVIAESGKLKPEQVQELIDDYDIQPNAFSHIISVAEDPRDAFLRVIAVPYAASQLKVANIQGIDFESVYDELLNGGNINMIFAALKSGAPAGPEVADILCKAQRLDIVARTLDAFTSLHPKTIELLAKNGYGDYILHHNEKLPPELRESALKQVFESAPSLALKDPESNLRYVDCEKIEKLVQEVDHSQELSFTVAEVYKQLSRPEDQIKLNRLLESALSRPTIALYYLNYSNKVTWATQKAYDVLSDYRANGGDDPEAHKGVIIKKTNALAFVLNGGETDKAEKLLDIPAERLAIIKTGVDRAVSYIMRYLQAELKDCNDISDLDKDSLFNAQQLPVYIKPFEEVLRSLAARFIVQRGYYDRDVTADYIGNAVIDVLNVPTNIRRIYKLEIPLYEELYKEFDEIRDKGRTPAEVYLGRDGVNAYLGRRTADAAKRRALDPQQRAVLKSKDQFKVDTRYLVYPSDFKYMETEAKENYLASSMIDPSIDPIFYDTGYKGSVPADILRTMGYDESEIDERIKLLDSHTPERQARRPSRHRPQETGAVGFIEGHPKLEQTARFVYPDSRTGKTEYYAQPSEAADQAVSLLIRHIIVRHFWLAERMKERELREEAAKQVQQIQNIEHLEKITASLEPEKYPS